MPKKSSPQSSLHTELLAALDTIQPEKVVSFFGKVSEEQRLSLASTVVDWIKKHPSTLYFALAGSRSDERENFTFAVQFAFLVTADMPSIRKGIGKKMENIFVYMNEAINAVLPLRSREWRDEFLVWLMDQRCRENPWPRYWDHYKNGSCSRLVCEPVVNQLLKFIDYPSHERPEINWNTVQFFENYPELLNEEFWFLFEHEFAKLYGFAYRDSHGYGKQPWNKLCVELVEKGMVSRDRLLDATLKTLSFNYPDNEMRWFSDLHRQLSPSLDEIQVREEKYLELLDNRNPSTVALVFEMLSQLDKGNRLNDRLLLDRISPIFNEKPKGRPKAAVGIIERIAKRDKTLRNEAIHTAMLALSHESVDVQTAAAKMILQYLDSSDNDIVSEIDRLIPSLHSSVQALLSKIQRPTDSTPKSRKTTSQNVTIVPRTYGPLDIARLNTAKRLTPVQTVNELIDLAVKVLETPSEIDAIELLHDGISRLHNTKDVDFERKTSAIRKKLLQGDLFHNTFTDYLFGKYVGVLIGSWLADSVEVNKESRIVSLKFGESNRTCKVSERLHAESVFGLLQLALVHRISQGITLEPLSTPTHHGGWIDPMILVERLNRDSHQLKQHDLLDKSLSLYRLAPDRRSEALKALNNHITGDSYVDALRAILGDEKPIIMEPYYSIAVQADEKTRRHEPIYRVTLASNTISDLLLELPDKVVDKSRVPVFCLASVFGVIPHYEHHWVRAMFQWRSNLCPAIRAPFYWHACPVLKFELEDMYDYPGPDAFLEPLLDSSEPVTETAATAVMIALIAKPESLATLAQDVLITSIGDGRLGAATLSAAFSYWNRNALPKQVRWIKRFQTVAAQSTGHAAVLRETLENTVSEMDAKIVGGFLELLHEYSVSLNTKITSEQCRRFLETLSGPGKAAKLAKKLLEL